MRMRDNGKVSGNITWILSFPGVLISGRYITVVNYCFYLLVLFISYVLSIKSFMVSFWELAGFQFVFVTHALFCVWSILCAVYCLAPFLASTSLIFLLGGPLCLIYLFISPICFCLFMLMSHYFFYVMLVPIILVLCSRRGYFIFFFSLLSSLFLSRSQLDCSVF